ncbi:MAG TPA: Lpg1974 family pore-forming outer membrane protein [Planctomycetaceae bacterium]|nr:Lpg1974 family pore-forming outer membrane protein [Planctomycetaceae bacterium]
MLQRVWYTAAAWMVWVAPIGAAWAQSPALDDPLATAAPSAATADGIAAAGLPGPLTMSWCGDSDAACAPGGCGLCGGSLYGSFDFLLARPHFSEAIAFAEVNPAGPRVDGRELQFGYDPSYRLRVGSWMSCGAAGFRATYWHFNGQTDANGVPAAPGFLIDPFGNVALPGTRIATEAEVRMNVYDLEFVSTHDWDGGCTTLAWTAGVRIADVDQSYDSLIAVGGLPITFGDFSADFIGAGPRIGLEAAHRRGPCSPLSLFASVHGSLLLGEYDVNSSNRVFLPGVGTAPEGAQHESLTRTIPVVEMELGASWQAAERWTIAAGWMFQAWFDLGTSGGRFENHPLFGTTPLFTGADDANIMSFDGFFLRAEMGF